MANSQSGPVVTDSPGGPGESATEAARIRRVIVCVDSAGVAPPALQVATGLALVMRASLAGIYVHRLVLNASPEKRIEKRTITETPHDRAAQTEKAGA